MRLDRYLASATNLTRKEARISIRSGAVAVDGQVLTDVAHHISLPGTVTLDGALVATRTPRYFMLHKPAGVICATKDAHQTTVIDLISIDNPDRLQIVGRLDKDTTGLVLLTDDGQWNHRITSPRSSCSKTYQVTTAEPIDISAIDQFSKGVVLKSENRRTRPAVLSLCGSRSAQLILNEGKYHQVKRMFAALGNNVTALHRSAIGGIHLDQTLQAGEYRTLTTNEIGTA